MKSILIKDTTREEREQIVRDSLGDDWDLLNTKGIFNKVPPLV